MPWRGSWLIVAAAPYYYARATMSDLSGFAAGRYSRSPSPGLVFNGARAIAGAAAGIGVAMARLAIVDIADLMSAFVSRVAAIATSRSSE